MDSEEEELDFVKDTINFREVENCTTCKNCRNTDKGVYSCVYLSNGVFETNSRHICDDWEKREYYYWEKDDD